MGLRECSPGLWSVMCARREHCVTLCGWSADEVAKSMVSVMYVFWALQWCYGVNCRATRTRGYARNPRFTVFVFALLFWRLVLRIWLRSNSMIKLDWFSFDCWKIPYTVYWFFALLSRFIVTFHIIFEFVIRCNFDFLYRPYIFSNITYRERKINHWRYINNFTIFSHCIESIFKTEHEKSDSSLFVTGFQQTYIEPVCINTGSGGSYWLPTPPPPPTTEVGLLVLLHPATETAEGGCRYQSKSTIGPRTPPRTGFPCMRSLCPCKIFSTA